jgi:esterase/lipase superfamily enzyme
MSRDDIKKIVAEFLSGKPLPKTGTFQMDENALVATVWELMRQLGVSEPKGRAALELLDRIRDLSRRALTLEYLINFITSELQRALQRPSIPHGKRWDFPSPLPGEPVPTMPAPQSPGRRSAPSSSPPPKGEKPPEAATPVQPPKPPEAVAAPPASAPPPPASPTPLPPAYKPLGLPRGKPAQVPIAAPRIVKSEYVVWYGTNRRRYDENDLTKGYSAERDRKVHYGSCRVYIPEAHKIGSLGSPWWKRLITRTDDRLKLREIKEADNTSFWHQIALRLSKLSVAERHAVIFVHGYNVSFHDAALRAAQIGVDLSIKGTMAFFSWPSQGSLRGYIADSATIEASEQDITDFMLDFATRSGAEAVHIIAHSMGNRGVLRAVHRIAQRTQQRSQVPFGQVILAAADVDSGTFRQLCGAYAQVARRTTLYVSERDRAVEASHWLHQFPRVGLMPPVCVTRGIDTVAVTNVDLTLLGHGYIGDAREVLTDIHQLITAGSPPEHRFGIEEETTPYGERFWMIRR